MRKWRSWSKLQKPVVKGRSEILWNTAAKNQQWWRLIGIRELHEPRKRKTAGTMHFALMLFVLRAVCAENINIRYLHAWFPTWGRALHPTAGPPQPPYPNPTHMTLDEFDHKVKEKQSTSAQHMCPVRLSDRPMPSVQSCYHRLKDLEHSFSLFLVHFSLTNKQKQKEFPFFITSIILHSI